MAPGAGGFNLSVRQCLSDGGRVGNVDGKIRAEGDARDVGTGNVKAQVSKGGGGGEQEDKDGDKPRRRHDAGDAMCSSGAQ